MSKELNTPGWLDDVIPPGHSGLNVGEDVYTQSEVKSIILTALLRYESERPARRPWASLSADPTHPADFADFDKFCRWIRANKDPDEHFRLLSSARDDPYGAMLWLYGLLSDAYEGPQPAAPGSETGDKP